MNGYFKRILKVNLSTKTFSDFIPSDDDLKNYIGGSGLAAKIFIDNYDVNVDPLAPENPLIIMTGPLCGTTLPSVPRFVICAKSPMTGIWGESNVGGYIGPEIRFAGLDGIIIEGKADKPTKLVIDGDKISIEDATDVWGKSTYDTVDALVEKHKSESQKKKVQVLCIGPSGEKLVKMAAITNNKHHYAGRTGMGAVMGSKNLKAVVVRGSKFKVPIADQTLLKEAKDRAREKQKESINIIAMTSFGSNSVMDAGYMMGDTPIKNWQISLWDEGAEKLNGDAYGNTILVDNGTCYGCPVACKREVEVKDGPFKTQKGPGPEYETVAMFGMNCFNDNIYSVAKANEICNKYGIDTISGGQTVAFAIECFEKGIISEKDTGGIKLGWGNAEGIVAILEKICKREDIGDVLAEGTRSAAKKLNAEDLRTDCLGLEIPAHDPRAAHGMGLAYATSTRGACHNSSMQHVLEHGLSLVNEIAKDAPNMQDSEGKAKMVIESQNYGNVLSQCAIVCLFGGMPWQSEELIDFLNSVTGFGLDYNKILEIGDRCWNLKHIINLKMGMNIKDYKLPKKFMTPAVDGGAEGSVPDMKLMLSDFITLRELDEKGYPKEARLKKLGLEWTLK